MASHSPHADRLSATDRLEIHDLLARYNHAHDFDDVDAWVATFAPDAEFVTRRSVSHGHEELRRFFLEGGERLSSVRHWINNVELELVEDDTHGEEVRGRCYMLLLQEVDGRPTLRLSGHYEDVLRRVDGRWRLARRQVHIDQGMDA